MSGTEGEILKKDQYESTINLLFGSIQNIENAMEKAIKTRNLCWKYIKQYVLYRIEKEKHVALEENVSLKQREIHILRKYRDLKEKNNQKANPLENYDNESHGDNTIETCSVDTRESETKPKKATFSAATYRNSFKQLQTQIKQLQTFHRNSKSTLNDAYTFLNSSQVAHLRFKQSLPFYMELERSSTTKCSQFIKAISNYHSISLHI